LRQIQKIRFATSLLAFPLLALLMVPVWARSQEPAGPAPTAQEAPPTEHMDEPETHAQLEAFRHSDAVKMIARHLGVTTETAAVIFQDINSAILIGLILWLILRTVPKMLRKRNETLQKQLLDARLAAAEANERLAVVEERLSKLGIEIESIREQTERDSAEDEKRIHESLEAERQRIVASAGQEIEAAGATAQRELKKFAAELAVDRARQGIHLGADGDRALIRTFGENLKGDRN
jgi:F-type H+-transporting ATPase subunit b